MKAAVVVLVALALPAPADACSSRGVSVFELFERAATVARVRVRSLPRRGEGRVHLTVRRMIKGDRKAKTLVTTESATSCAVGFRPKQDGIVFLSADGVTLWHGQGFIREHLARYEALIDAWIAGDAVARRGLVVATVLTNDDMLSHDAAIYLADDPVLIAKLDADQRAQLAAVTPKTEFSGVRYVQERLAKNPYEGERDPTKLAAIIGATKDPARIAAMERCERLHGKRLYPYSEYRAGLTDGFWEDLADACRTGTPVP